MPNKILNTTCARCVDHITNSQLIIFQNVQIKLKLVILKHIIKGIVKLIRDFLDLELLTVDLILNIINSEVQFRDVHLSVFIASLSNLESLHKCVNFVLEFLFPFLSFLSRNLKLFHVLTNSFQFLFNISEFTFSQFSSLIGSLQFILLNSQFSGQFIKFLLVVRCHLCGFSQVFVSLFNLNFIVHGFVLKVFARCQMPSLWFLSSFCQPLQSQLHCSWFCSLSDAIFVVSLKFLSASSISTSLFMVLFSKYLTCFKIASASLEARASLVTVSAKLPSAFLASSSMSMIRRLRALTSSSAFLKFFSASSRVVRALFNLSFVSSKSTS